MLLWLNPTTGVSGDMLLGALLGLGARLEAMREAVSSAGLPGWQLEHQSVDVDGLRADRAVVRVVDDRVERRAAELIDHVRAARPVAVASVAERAIRAIAEAEAHLHGQHPDDVHLHELGGLDTVVDTLGVAAGLHDLGVHSVHSSPVALGTGTVSCAHGVLPAPAPATMRLLNGASVIGADLHGETVTPTGAALLSAIGTRYAPPRAMIPRATAYGAGTRRFPRHPNVLTATVSEQCASADGADGTHDLAAWHPAPADSTGTDAVHISIADPTDQMAEEADLLVLLACTVDDVTAETLGHLLARALESGAADAWAIPAVMKKSRPGHVVQVLCFPEQEPALRELVLAETGSLGLRRQLVHRHALPRTTATVAVEGHCVRVKQGPWRAKPEHADVAAVAEALGLPLHDVATRALQKLMADAALS